MIRSMTGFGRFEKAEDGRKLTVEIKAVNHRYLDLGIKMPRKFNCFEARIRTVLKQYLQRGKVDVFISYENDRQNQASLVYNAGLAQEYMKYFSLMSKELNIANDIAVSDLVKCPEVLVMGQSEEDEEELWTLLSEALEEAVKRMVNSRQDEGGKLRLDLLCKLDHMEQMVACIEENSPEVVSQYRARLEEKVRELLDGPFLDEARIIAEVTIFADKICVDEETVRLKSHIESTRQVLNRGGAIGRKLDFIAQEMNREANTILSKAGSLSISDQAIELKTEVEKVREQIQNLE